MPTLAIAGGTPVRRAPFTPWPQFDEAERAGVLEVLESRAWGGYPFPNRAGTQIRGAFRRRSWRAAWGVRRKRHDHARDCAERLRASPRRRSAGPRVHVRSHGRPGVAPGWHAGLRGCPPRHLLHRRRCGGSGDHAADAWHHAGPSRHGHGRHGCRHGPRRIGTACS